MIFGIVDFWCFYSTEWDIVTTVVVLVVIIVNDDSNGSDGEEFVVVVAVVTVVSLSMLLLWDVDILVVAVSDVRKYCCDEQTLLKVLMVWLRTSITRWDITI